MSHEMNNLDNCINEIESLRKEIAEIKKSRKGYSLRKNLLWAVMAATIIPLSIFASHITKPWPDFSTGDLIEANKINDNFNTLYTKSNSLDDSVTSLNSSVTSINSSVSTLSSQVAAINQAPIGAIIPWYDGGGLIGVPDGWQICDGSQISDARSPLKNHYTPNLTGDTYLTGTSSAVNWSSAPPSKIGTNSASITIPAHYHGHTLSISGGSHTHNFYGTHDSTLTSGYGTSLHGYWPDGAYYSVIQSSTHSHPNGEFSGTIGNGSGQNGNNDFTGSGDTRPLSIRVKYLIKIYEQ